MKTCCKLHPMCYCQVIPSDRAHETRMKILRSSTPGDVEAANVRARNELESLAQPRRQPRLSLLAIALVTALIVVVGLLAGCGPDDGVIKPSSPAPQPETSEMFTVIKPGNHLGGIYDNN